MAGVSARSRVKLWASDWTKRQSELEVASKSVLSELLSISGKPLCGGPKDHMKERTPEGMVSDLPVMSGLGTRM